MADKPYEFNELSTTPCVNATIGKDGTIINKPAHCKGFIKMNVIHRKPAAGVCFKCTAAGQRDAARKRARKTYKAAMVIGDSV